MSGMNVGLLDVVVDPVVGGLSGPSPDAAVPKS
jgi:hypothetical protein